MSGYAAAGDADAEMSSELIKQMKPPGFSVQEMGRLLYSRDTLRDPQADRDQRDAAAARVLGGLRREAQTTTTDLLAG